MSKESMQHFLDMMAKNPEVAEKVKEVAQKGPQAFLDYAEELGYAIEEEDLKELGEKVAEALKVQIKKRTEKLLSDLEKEQSPQDEGMKNLIQFMKDSEEDEAVKTKLNELVAKDPSAVIDYARERGYDFSEKDLDRLGKALLEQKEELSEEDLDQVAGGGPSVAVAIGLTVGPASASMFTRAFPQA